jgi:hypothetical protein
VRVDAGPELDHKNTELRERLNDADREYVLSVSEEGSVFAAETIFEVPAQRGVRPAEPAAVRTASPSGSASRSRDSDPSTSRRCPRRTRR